MRTLLTTHGRLRNDLLRDDRMPACRKSRADGRYFTDRWMQRTLLYLSRSIIVSVSHSSSQKQHKRIFCRHNILTTKQSFPKHFSPFQETMNATSMLFLVLAAATSSVSAFQVQPANRIRSSLLAVKDGSSQPTTVDIKRAKFCEEHFGECSVEEIEQLRNGTL